MTKLAPKPGVYKKRSLVYAAEQGIANYDNIKAAQKAAADKEAARKAADQAAAEKATA